MADGETSRAGGSLLAFSIIGGTVVGVILGQPSLGFLGGAGVGLLLVGLVWLKSRARPTGGSGDPAAGPDDPAD